MKRNFLVCMALTVLLAACVTAEPNGPAAGMDLDTAVKEVAVEMDARLPVGTKVALVSVASPSAAFSEQVIIRLEAALVRSGKLVVVDRANLDKIRAEQGFQLSGEVDDDSAKAIGKLLGAGAIVTGSTTDMGDAYTLALKAINIETATVVVSYPADLAKTQRIQTLMASGGGAAAIRGGGAPVKTAPAAPAPAAAAQGYKIGDTGPAGGIVFHDKGAFTNGWRYLEAAPNDLVPMQWGTFRIDVGGTSGAVGTGKANTERIVAVLEQRGEDGAALFCAILDINGHKDWFLPSYDELDLMRKNLKLKGLGGFNNGYYWSSTQSGSGNFYVDPRSAYAISFSNGEATYMDSKPNAYSVRAIRQF
jgi:hypothetical protein